MSEQDWLSQGLARFGDFLVREYGQPLSHWSAADAWGDAQSLQIARALACLMREPIADVSELSPDETAASETGAQRRWTISDAKIAEPAFASAWQYALLAEIENAQEKEPGQMAVPADPRRFALYVAYQRSFFGVLADHLLRLLCERVKLPTIPETWPASAAVPEEALLTVNLLRQVPGLETADAAFIAGLVVLISKTGPRGFEDWCEERSASQSDDRL